MKPTNTKTIWWRSFLVLLLGCLLLLAACGKKPAAPSGSAAATPSATPAVTAAATPSATPAVTAAATPSATPAVTAAATPSATPAVTAAATPSAAPAAQSESESAKEEETSAPEETEEADYPEEELSIEKDGSYTSAEEVAAYIHTYGWLPDNFISKKEAEKLGWNSKEGNLWEVAPGKSIGGSRFGNYEGNLPEASGRKYYECDINYAGGYRGPERLVFSNDGLIFYTEDHYNTFEQLY